MKSKRTGIILYISATIILLTSLMIGNGLQADLRSFKLDEFASEYGPVGQLRLLFFAFGFPFGLGLALIGVTLYGGSSRKNLVAIILVSILVTLTAGLIPTFFGRSLSAIYFGTGGYSILLLYLLSIWYWGQYRQRASAKHRHALDLQGMGYLCFAIAIWNLCGAATMPSFSLEPEMMMQMNAQPFAIGQMKSIMALFIIGWVFTLAGFLVSVNMQRGKSDSQ